MKAGWRIVVSVSIALGSTMPAVGGFGSAVVQAAQPTLRIGAHGTAVKQLQAVLIRLGYLHGAADGAFGPQTRSAVLAFQKAHHLSADGIVGPKTWAALDAALSGAASASTSRSGGTTVGTSSSATAPTYKYPGSALHVGSRGTAVQLVQQRLKSLGYPVGTVDGVYGSKTAAAVKSFQRGHHLTADGIVGAATWGALFGTQQTSSATRSSSSSSTGAAKTSTTTTAVKKDPPGVPAFPGTALKQGSRGTAVTQVQSRLNALGFAVGTVDGVFGSKTATAVRNFQRAHHLTVDGVVGPATWKALFGGSTTSGGTSPSTSRSGGPAAPVANGTLTLQVRGHDVVRAEIYQISGKTFIAIPSLATALKQAGFTVSLTSTSLHVTASSKLAPPAGTGSGDFSVTLQSAKEAITIRLATMAVIDPLSKAPIIMANVDDVMGVLKALGVAQHRSTSSWDWYPQGYAVVDARGNLVGLYSREQDAEQALTGLGGHVYDGYGNLITYTAYSAKGAVIGQYPTLAAAKADLNGYSQAVVKDYQGNVVYKTPAIANLDFLNVDLRHQEPNTITAGVIDAYLLSNGSPLYGLGDWTIWAAHTYGVDANYLISHAIHETAYGNSNIYKQKNNLFGYGAYDSDPTNDAGFFPNHQYMLAFEAWFVRNQYLDPDGSLYVTPTLTGMNQHYATDPNWSSAIAKYMSQIADSAGDSVVSYQQYTVENQEAAPAVTDEPVLPMKGASGSIASDDVYNNAVPYFADMKTGEHERLDEVLRYGAKGSKVRELQTQLNKLRFNVGTVDGVFGPKTQAAVKMFQGAHNLPVTGVCDAQTWNAVFGYRLNTMPANTKVQVLEWQEGFTNGNIVTPWLEVTDGTHTGWVPYFDVKLTNVYRVDVRSNDNIKAYVVPVKDASGRVIGELHSGDIVIAASSDPSGGSYRVSYFDLERNQSVTGLVDAATYQLVNIYSTLP
ncbi:MAG: peptidoglycan-binding protein [Thermoflavifilum sp.]|nr:peptidoglycan-binding protein [Thermoflavifilum sp.]MCL6515138.1 peptidoglycan-binding protein [Alicyclobacillus sp.]